MKNQTLARLLLFMLCVVNPSAWAAETNELRVLNGTGGIGFLQLYIMSQQKSVEKYATQLGHPTLKVSYMNFGGPSVANDALLSGSADIVPAGPPGFITMWDRTRTSAQVKGVAAMASLPMYLNTRNPRIHSIRDITAQDKIAIIAIKVSVYALILQMAARKEFGPSKTFSLDQYTVGLPHAEGVAALTSRGGEIDLHFTGAPFSDLELKDPRVKTILNSDEVMGGATSFTMLYTTTKFHDANPITYKAFLQALQDATAYINDDKNRAAELYLESIGGKRQNLAETQAMFTNPSNIFTTTPQNVLKYARFMKEIGTIKNEPSGWKDLFFSEVHALPGS